MTKRNTLQKGIVLDTVRSLKNHPSADEVYFEVQRDYPSISRATVYRNLNSLAESGDIAKRLITDGPDRFDHNCTNHYHLHCVKCKGVFDVDMDYQDGLNDPDRFSDSFYVFKHDIIFSGLCPFCNQKSAKAPEKGE